MALRKKIYNPKHIYLELTFTRKKWNIQHSPMHVSSELSPSEFNGIYTQENVYRIAAFKYQTSVRLFTY